MKSLRFLCAAGCLIPTACATNPRGGAVGFVMFDPNQHVAAAEPLFGQGDEQCLNDPTFLLSTFAQDSPGGQTQPKDPNNPDICTRIKWSLYWGLKSHGGTLTNYDARARNEVVGAILAASDRKCGNYVAFLQQYNGNVKAGFGIIDTAASALATVASGGLNRALTVTSTLAGHTRSELEEAHFANQALGVLTQAFRQLRDTQRKGIEDNLQSKTVDNYTMSQGLADVFNYHASCSIVVGLEQAQKAVSEKGNSDAGTDKTGGKGGANGGNGTTAGDTAATTTTTTTTTGTNSAGGKTSGKTGKTTTASKKKKKK
jgi:hypothetical protein